MIGVQICPPGIQNQMSFNPVSEDVACLRPPGLRIRTEHLLPEYNRPDSEQNPGYNDILSPRDFQYHTFGVPNHFASPPPPARPAPKRVDSTFLRARRAERYRVSYDALKTALGRCDRATHDSVVGALEGAAAYMNSVVHETKQRIEELRTELADRSSLDKETVADMQKERWMIERRYVCLEGDEKLVEKKVHELKTNSHAPARNDAMDKSGHDLSIMNPDSRRRTNLAMFFERSPTKVYASRRRMPTPIRVDNTTRVRTPKNLSSPKRLRPPSPRAYLKACWKLRPLPDLPSPSTTSIIAFPRQKTTEEKYRLSSEMISPTRARTVTASTASDSAFSPIDDHPRTFWGTALVQRPIKLSAGTDPPSLRMKVSDSNSPADIPEYVWDLLDQFDLVGEDITFASDPPPPSPALPQFARPQYHFGYSDSRFQFSPSDSLRPSSPAEDPPPSQPSTPQTPPLGHARRRTTAFSLSRWAAPFSFSSASSHRPPELHVHINTPINTRRRSQSHPLPLSPGLLYAIPESPNSAMLSPPPVAASMRSRGSARSYRSRTKSSISSLFRLGSSPAEESRSQETLFGQATSPESSRDPLASATAMSSPYSPYSARDDVSASLTERGRTSSLRLSRNGSVVDRLRKRLHVFN
ncbi:hypothetical protein GLOTRDRAFT_139423 [Gloeophyllum trabeum ATCC 11539]|uniref:Uncharacterized protein n=1 Tax=Gloeophyllum trabeum (strain ATCC 11539 / FP-39264 / Madison 617) TaxID=670483 RepID=S7RI87_GLOTA|nr:uncharacterized protein GLOTRDRAFT_139423 [Gloeophyllum trabeum ATCC 11539]EPQ53985.1 hypothetical protein GLOTRDRAFT_139423 [Gloeophyllum trabeum ATCC 11539]